MDHEQDHETLIPQPELDSLLGTSRNGNEWDLGSLSISGLIFATGHANAIGKGRKDGAGAKMLRPAPFLLLYSFASSKGHCPGSS